MGGGAFIVEKILKFMLTIYIISLYVFNNAAINSTNYVSLVLFFVIFFIWIIDCIKKHRIHISKYYIFYMIFIILGSISYLFALQKSYVISKVIQLLMNSFIIAGLILSLLMFFTSDFANASKYNRIGSQIGNVNAISICLCYSLSAIFIMNNKSKKKINIFLIVLITIAILFTGSRKGILIVILLTLFSYFIKNIDNLHKTAKNIIISIIAVTLVFLLIMNVPFLYNMVGIRFISLFDFVTKGEIQDFSMMSRNNMIKVGIEWFKLRPFRGYGLDNFRFLYNKYFGYDYYAHNNYIELLVDLGVIGVIVYYLFYMYIFKNLLSFKLHINYKTCIFFSVSFILLIMDYARVSFEDRILVIYMSIIFSYIKLYKNGGIKNEKSNSNNVDI